MKKPLSSLPMKIAAVLLSYVMVLVLVVSVAAVAFMGYFNFYFTSKHSIQKNLLGDMASGEAYNLAVLYDLERDIEYYYEDSNVYYTIETSNGETVVSNYNGEDIITAEQHYGEDYIYTIYVADEMTTTDEFSFVSNLIDIGYSLRYAFIFFAIISLLAFIVILYYLYCAAGHKSGQEGVSLNYLDMIPSDIYLAAVVTAFIISAYFVFDVFWEGLELIIALFVFGTLLYFLTLGFTMSVATRMKTRTLIKNTLIYKVLSFVKRCIEKTVKMSASFIRKLPLIWKTVLVLAAVILLGGFYLACTMYDAESLTLGYVMFSLVLTLAVLYVTIVLQKIKVGGERIASGDLEHKIDTKYMVLDFKEFSENLNSINDGLQFAVNEKMKSERFKTELITNVSHDIKTPLTSIINYVDLLKKQEIQNDTANEYIAVLDRQSERLKKLVEDLVEASKASTGSLPVNLAPCDIGVLLSQMIGEFDEKFKKAELNTVLKMPPKNVIIKADARHLWRVIENLLNNICKYSQNGTRVYIDVAVVGSKAVVTFKNISRYELNINPDELMERFVRGDKSRNTEGSGLGLSIAKSLTEIQNGKMDMSVDGDLFKVTLQFDAEVK